MKKYKTIDTWAKAMRKDKNKKLWQDWFNIGGHWYTCEEYDDSGKYMRYTSVTAWKHLDIDTDISRYTSSWLTTMKVTEYPIESLRFDINYYIDDIKKLTKKQIMTIYDNLNYIDERGTNRRSLLEALI